VRPHAMSTQIHMSVYTPVKISTPTQSLTNTPVSTPSRAALLKPSFVSRESPIKFSLSTSERTPFKDVEFDWDEYSGKKKWNFYQIIMRVLIWSTWTLLVAAAAYL
jgi:hypothetical protein